MELNDTIAALASAPGPADRGIVRVSGDNVVEQLVGHFVSADDRRPDECRRAEAFDGEFDLKCISERLPARLLVWPTKRSYTGQPMAEIHTVGSPPLLEAVLAQLFESGVRPAKNGEFTLRAFLCGRIDLIQAEAVLGVIDSTDQQQMERALRQLGGGVSGKLADTRAELIAILGDLEAGLDFVEEDIEFIPSDVMIERLRIAIERLEQLAASSESRMESSVTATVALGGLPNAGKSTLFNALAKSDEAIVSPIAGTTRDYLTVDIDCDGTAVRLIDTAGQERADSAIMQTAQQFRGEQLAESKLIVWCSAADLTTDEQVDDEGFLAALTNDGRPVLHVQTKNDTNGGNRSTAVLSLSAATGAGLSELKAQIAELLDSKSGDSELIGSTGARCRDSLGSAIQSLRAAKDAAVSQMGDEIIAIELRAALEDIGTILGTVYTDDILDHIFSNFCIGK
ncbi:MAG: tRNA modification GTPase [Planctomycetaceae bacterium]